ncbi:DUF3099 domain-containing protein [Streptomyces purpurogeneiscleroticus]|uniref:DUF3099 domain-containing protein n=1 Tax=Streptomyces purpurogeneiscleroticus TaxID=68259 RepID=UPI001CBB1BB4|nr:DUF3099 domain-containing protein [Streptomyces purpurogeneiscleroticus]MBZ4020388.1 hypothetical protein [Streptomyces purpurogeneiscleroticus]
MAGGAALRALRTVSSAAARSYRGDMSVQRRHRRYYAMMAVCLTLFVLAWGVVRLWSVPAAVAMCVVAMIIPPFAAIVANRREPGERWWDESGDPESDRWWRELDDKGRR